MPKKESVADTAPDSGQILAEEPTSTELVGEPLTAEAANVEIATQVELAPVPTHPSTPLAFARP